MSVIKLLNGCRIQTVVVPSSDLLCDDDLSVSVFFVPLFPPHKKSQVINVVWLLNPLTKLQTLSPMFRHVSLYETFQGLSQAALRPNLKGSPAVSSGYICGSVVRKWDGDGKMRLVPLQPLSLLIIHTIEGSCI